jgi:NADPH:quinone reductase-like Zn-dependent oxidoreductase
MKAAVVKEYGTPDVLRYEDYPDPVAGPREMLIRVTATSINPADIARRSGKMKDKFPITFPGIIGFDVSGTIQRLGPGVEGFSIGDKVFAYTDRAYAELCAVKASNVSKIPHGLDLVEAAALPVVGTTGNQLITRGTGISSGQTVLILGAAGSVGRCAVATAIDRGASVIAAVRGNQVDGVANLGADIVISTDDVKAIVKLPLVDAVADTVGGKTAEAMISKVKAGGVFASVVSAPGNARDFSLVKSVWVGSSPDADILFQMGKAVVDKRLSLPIARKMPLKDAAVAHAAFESGVGGKILLLA